MADVQSLSIFTGSGFHDTGVELALEALGYRLQPVGYIERDAAAAATLLARMGTQTLGRAPVWCDCISRVDAKPLRGFVDLLIASPPCQPYSSAGKRLGTKDHRSHGDGDGPLVHLARIFDECRPAVGWFENVGEWFTGGHFREFGEELSRMGYEIQEPIFSSSAALGNVHERERVFCMVHAHGHEQGRWNEPRRGSDRRGAAAGTGGEMGDAERLRAGAGEQGEQGHPRIWWDRPANAGAGLVLPSRGGLGELREPSGSDGQPDGGDKEVANPDGGGLPTSRERQGRNGDPDGFYAPLCPPGRDDYAAWARLAAQGLDTTLFPAIESGLSVVADEVAPSASDLLRIGGNGVDPLVVADAFLRAWARLRRERVT